MKGTYLKETAEELQFLRPGRSYDWRFRAHNLQEKCYPRRCGFRFSPPMTKAKQTPPGSENPMRVLTPPALQRGPKALFHPPPPALAAGQADVTILPQNSPPRLSAALNEPSGRKPARLLTAQKRGAQLHLLVYFYSSAEEQQSGNTRTSSLPAGREGVKEKTLQFND